MRFYVPSTNDAILIDNSNNPSGVPMSMLKEHRVYRTYVETVLHSAPCILEHVAACSLHEVLKDPMAKRAYRKMQLACVKVADQVVGVRLYPCGDFARELKEMADGRLFLRRVSDSYPNVIYKPGTDISDMRNITRGESGLTLRLAHSQSRRRLIAEEREILRRALEAKRILDEPIT